MSRESAGPFLHYPGPPLSQHISYIGYWEHDGGAPHRSTALPRGAVTIVIDLSGRKQMEFAAVGGPAMQVSPAIVTGAGTSSYVTRIDPGQTVMTVHFRPAGARAFLGIPLCELQDHCVAVDEIFGDSSRILRERLTSTTATADRVRLLERFLLDRMQIHDLVVHPLLTRLDTEPSITVAEVCALTDLSPKRLTALFGTEVGLTPKTYLRVRRLQAALRRLETGAQSGADIAADLGYFDQAHFVRDFRSFTGITPSQYPRRRANLPSHLMAEMYKPALTAG